MFGIKPKRMVSFFAMLRPQEQKQTQDIQTTSSEEFPSRRRGCGGLFLLIMLIFGAAWGAALGAFVWMLQDAKNTVQVLNEFRPKTGSKVYSADGELLGEFSAEQRQLVNLSEIPLRLQKAFIATEDDEFYRHKGFRITALINGALYILQTGHARGGSTITQQVIRNIGDWQVAQKDELSKSSDEDPQAQKDTKKDTSNNPLGVGKERTYVRKLKEILMALQLERDFTKDEILELYLNGIFLGVSAHGVQAAAQQYFGKDCWDLTTGECAQ